MDVAIIGGGPAGLIAAERLSAAGRSVTVFDRMPSVGRKFLLAGRGGLNITHSEPLDRFVARYGAAPPWLGPALAGFDPAALRAWCAELGEPTVVGSSGRVFPQSFKATPLLRAWLRRLAVQGVTIAPGHRWVGGTGDELNFETASGRVTAYPRATLLAMGGASWPRLGSDGGWVSTLAETVTVTPLSASNVAMLHAWSDPFRTRFAGAPLKRIAARIGDHTVRGEAIITATGLEGGVIYALSRPIRDALQRVGEAHLELDLRPDLDAPELARRMGGPGVSRANAWRRAGLSPVAAGLLRELGGTPKHTVVTLTGTAPIARAISTAGGIASDALDEHLMLRTCPGTFAAGEMLDWDAPTGGYLMQACFATGWHAAGGILDWLGMQRSPGLVADAVELGESGVAHQG